MASPASRIAGSFGYALAGLAALVRTQPNFGVHLGVSVVVVILAVVLRAAPAEVAVLALTIGVVLTAEAFNTALEAVCDLVSPGFHPLVKLAKDVAAAGVLLSALAAVVVGLAIFAPRILAAVSMR